VVSFPALVDVFGLIRFVMFVGQQFIHYVFVMFLQGRITLPEIFIARCNASVMTMMIALIIML